MTEEFDAIVIGATTRGLVATYVLDSLGYRTLLADRRPFVGGADASFVAADGSVFEFGMHVLDDKRSPLATRLFRQVLNDRVCRTQLRRGIVLRGQSMPYAPTPEQMPDDLRSLLASGPLSDDIGDALPTRSALAGTYGERFADLIFDEVLPSFPSEARHLEFGVDESKLLTNIYPWFFPHAKRSAKTNDASRAFHDLLRAGKPQHILYPEEGGFGAFSQGFLDSYNETRTRVAVGAQSLDIDLDEATRGIRSVTVNGQSCRATHYFWGDSWPALCKLADLPCQHVATDRIVLGSFSFNAINEPEFHELLIGDPTLHINRLYFPGAFTGRTEPRLQIEFAFPVAEEDQRGIEPETWRSRWLADLSRLGIVDDLSEVTMYDFKTRELHFNSYGMEGEALIDADPRLIPAASNITPLAPSMANWNLNTHVPRTAATVIAALAAE